MLAQNVEAQLIKVPTGCQDYYPALYGGVNSIHLTMEGIQREAMPVPKEMIDSQFLLVYTGMPRHSGINNWEVFKSHIAGDKKVVKNFAHISALSSAMHKAFLKLDWDEVARLIREDWKLRRSNYEKISTPLIDKLIAVAAKSGGRAAKVCGAGGGGCVIFMVKDGAQGARSRSSADEWRPGAALESLRAGTWWSRRRGRLVRKPAENSWTCFGRRMAGSGRVAFPALGIVFRLCQRISRRYRQFVGGSERPQVRTSVPSSLLVLLLTCSALC